MKHEMWTIAYKKKVGAEFKTIANTWRYWCADPHLYEHEGHNYVFAELYDRVLRQGVIGYCEINENSVSPWKVILKMPYHLSYPHIFSDETGIYMIPESYVAEEIALFKAIEFPNKWEKLSVLKKNFVTVDSTVFEYSNKQWVLTLQFKDNQEYLKLFEFDKQGLKGKELCIVSNDANKRPAGHFFYSNGKLIRPAQDCSDGYGCALNFYEVVEVSEDKYEEKLIRKVLPEEIKTDLKEVPQGIHTYNQNEMYEVIDLKGYETDWLFYVMRPIWYIWRRIRKVFH